VGFESSEVARRRLAVRARSHQGVQDALRPAGGGPGWSAITWSPPVADLEAALVASAETEAEVVGTLELLAQDLVETPGAGGALLAAFARQARALHLVAEAARRSPDAPLPADVLEAVRASLPTAAPQV
jgi:hypothetical protein